MHGTGCFTQLIVLCRRRLRRHARRPAPSTSASCSTPSSARGSTPSPSSATRSPSRCCRALDAEPRPVGPLEPVHHHSSGVMWSEPAKQGLLSHHPACMLVDAFSSSEALGMGQSVSSAGGAEPRPPSSRSARTPACSTTTAATSSPGSGEIGRVAVGGFQPVGYYKDPRSRRPRSSSIDGERYSVPGRLRHGRGGRHASPCSAAARCASTPAARRSSPRRSRRPSRRTRRARRRRRRRARREVRRGDHRRGRAGARRRRSTRAPSSPTCKAGWRPTRRPSACSPSTRSAAPPTARSTTSASRRTPSALGVPL